MKLSIVSADQLAARVTARWGDVNTDEALLELLRAEVTARRSCTRWAAQRRIEQAVAPFAWEGTAARLADLCAALEREGDFSPAAGGVLHVTPVRAIAVEQGLHRIVCSLPTSRLVQYLPGTVEVSGVRRSHRFSETDEATAAGAVRSLGGIVVSPQAWAGLALAPLADASWIKNLEQRLEWQLEAAGSLERDGALEWSGLTLTDDGPKWRRASEEPSRLWRARGASGRWFWAWTVDGYSPSTGDFVSLNSDESSRTVFALARVAEQPISCSLAADDGAVRLLLREWLPRAEYRYLSMLATLSRVENDYQWSIPASRVDDVLGTLGRRLGLEVRVEGPE